MPGVPSRRELAQFTDWDGRTPSLLTWWPQARWPARAHARHHESTRHELTTSRRISPLSVTDRWEILPRFTKAHHRPPGRTQVTPYTTGKGPTDPTRRTRIQCWTIKNVTFLFGGCYALLAHSGSSRQCDFRKWLRRYIGGPSLRHLKF